MRRFWAWFIEPVEQLRGWAYLAIGFASLVLLDKVTSWM